MCLLWLMARLDFLRFHRNRCVSNGSDGLHRTTFQPSSKYCLHFRFHLMTTLTVTQVDSTVLPVSFFDWTPSDSRFCPLESGREYWTCVSCDARIFSKTLLRAGRVVTGLNKVFSISPLELWRRGVIWPFFHSEGYLRWYMTLLNMMESGAAIISAETLSSLGVMPSWPGDLLTFISFNTCWTSTELGKENVKPVPGVLVRSRFCEIALTLGWLTKSLPYSSRLGMSIWLATFIAPAGISPRRRNPEEAL